MKALFFTAFALLLSTQNAQAGFLLEPYLGYQTLAAEVKIGSAIPTLEGQSIKTDGSGSVLGMRLGFTISKFFAAFDYSMAGLDVKITEAPAAVRSYISGGTQGRTSMGATVGLNLPVVRPYLGYIFDDQTKGSSEVNYGSGFKVGLGFAISKIRLNAEYQTVTYTKSKDSSTETTFSSSGIFSSMTASGFSVNVSLPLEL